MENACYFSHDSNARNDPKILRLRIEKGWEGYGIYFGIIELLREQKEYIMPLQYNCISFALQTNESIIKSIVEEYNLFIIKDGYFWSNSLIKRMKIKDEKSLRYSQNAKKRWKINNNNAMAMQQQCNGNAMAMQIDANKEKESKEKEINKDIVDSKKTSPPLITSENKNFKIDIPLDEDGCPDLNYFDTEEYKQKLAELTNQSNLKEIKNDHRKFIPPTKEEIIAFANENNLDNDVDAFFDYYESNGWKVGKNKMSKWKNAYSGWISRSKNYNKNYNNNTNSYKPRAIVNDDAKYITKTITFDNSEFFNNK